MKAVYLALLIALAALGSAEGGMRIQLIQNTQASNPASGLVYDLGCSGATGNVVFDVAGLPSGVSYSGNSIVVTNGAVAGTYPIQISATDSTGQTAQIMLNLSIIFGSQGASGAYNGANNGANNGGFNGGLNGSNNGANNGNTGINGGSFPNGGFPNGGSPNGGSPNGGSPNGGFPNGGFPNGGSPNGGSPNGGFPNGGSPNGGSPNGGSPNGGSPNGPGRLDTIIANFANVPAFTPPSYPGNRYPSSGLPSGADPNAVNPVPSRIATENAPRTPANRNPITPDDVALKAASERYQNAVKGITNLLTIVDQARANKNKAQNDMGPYTQALNNAIARQRDVQNGIISIELRSAQIKSAIAGAQGKHDNLKQKVNDLIAQQNVENNKKNAILDGINGEEGKRTNLVNQLDKINSDLAGLVNLLRNTQEKCAKIDAELAQTKTDLANKENDLRTFTTRRIQAANDVDAKQDIVNRLRAQLDAAERDLADAKIRLTEITNEEKLLPGQIANLKSRVGDLTSQAASCARETADIQARIDALKGGDFNSLTQQVADITNKIMEHRKQVTEIDGKNADNAQVLEGYKAQLNDLVDTINYLNSQTVTVDTQLRQAYASGNDANTAVAHARQNLDAVNKRFQDESRIESEATLNLERARAEEALAKLALDEIVARYSNALPYAIVPNGNGVGAGAPTGNNPSGSPLGPATKGTDGFPVSDWTHYLSSAFGAGINPAYDGNVNALYPFVFRLGANAVPAGTNGLRGTNGAIGPNGIIGGTNGVIGGTNGLIATNGVIGGTNGLGGIRIAGNGSGCGGNAGTRSITGTITRIGGEGIAIQTK